MRFKEMSFETDLMIKIDLNDFMILKLTCMYAYVYTILN